MHAAQGKAKAARHLHPSEIECEFTSIPSSERTTSPAPSVFRVRLVLKIFHVANPEAESSTDNTGRILPFRRRHLDCGDTPERYPRFPIARICLHLGVLDRRKGFFSQERRKKKCSTPLPVSVCEEFGVSVVVCALWCTRLARIE